LAIRGEAFDGRDIRSAGLHREHRARLHGLRIEQNRARAADRSLAAHVRSGQSQHIAQVMHEQQTRLDFVVMIDTIDVDTDSLLHKATSLEKNFPEGGFNFGWGVSMPLSG